MEIKETDKIQFETIFLTTDNFDYFGNKVRVSCLVDDIYSLQKIEHKVRGISFEPVTTYCIYIIPHGSNGYGQKTDKEIAKAEKQRYFISA